MEENLELSLLCTETNLDDDDKEEKGMIFEKIPIVGRGESSISQMGFPSESEEIIREMMETEKQHLPKDDYFKRLTSGDLDLNVKRRQAFNWIWKV